MKLSPKSFWMSVLITALVATGPLSTDMYLPALPDIRHAFGVGVSEVQLTLSVFMLGFAVAQLILGPLSDRFGRRPVLMSGMALYVAASILCVVAESMTMLIFARFVQAIGVCAGSAVGRAMVRDIYGPKDSAAMMAHISTAIALAPLVAPLMGGRLALAFGWPSIFMVMAGIGMILWAATVFLLSETNTHLKPDALNPKRFMINYSTLLGSADYRRYLYALTFSFAGLFAFISGSSFVIIEGLGLSVDAFALAFSAVVIGYMVGAQTGARLSKKHSLDYTLKFGGSFIALSSLAAFALLFITEPTIWTLCIPMAFYVAGVGLIMPTAMAAAMAPFPQMAGAASALMGFIQMTVAAGAGIVVGLFHDGSPVPMLSVLAICGVMVWATSRRIPSSAEQVI